MGYDTMQYYNMFKADNELSFSEIWGSFYSCYIERSGIDYDFGFVFMERVIGQFTDNYRIYKIISSLIIYIPFGIMLNRYAQNVLEVCFAYVFFVTFLYQGVVIGFRQAFAMGMCICFFLAVCDHKNRRAILYLLIAYTLHRSSALILLPLAISFLPNKSFRGLCIALLLLVPIIAVFANPIISFMGNFIGSEKYAHYGMQQMAYGGVTFIIMAFLLSVFCVIIFSPEFLEDRRYKLMFSMLPAFIFSSPLIYSNGAMIRVTKYYITFLTILIPALINFQWNDERHSYSYLRIMVAVLWLLSIKGEGVPYDFFWNDPIVYR